ESIESRWNAEHTMIYTYIEIALSNLLKGTNAGDAVTVKLLGGAVGNIVTVMTGAPHFRTEEEILLFIRTVNQEPFADFPTVTGFAQGKFNIQTTPGANSKIVTRDISATEFVGGRQSQFLDGPLSLEAFVKMIQDELKNLNSRGAL
ncbi:MAG: hypothetical protein ACE5D6_08835, partial [Candidatus Zixiibacteriota bacterium]